MSLLRSVSDENKSGDANKDGSLPPRRPRLKLKPRSKPLTWAQRHLGARINNGTYGIIYELKVTTTNAAGTRIVESRVDPRRVVKGTIERVARRECQNCPQRYIDEVMHHRLVLRILRECKFAKSSFAIEAPEIGNGPFFSDDYCYYVMERLYPANINMITDKLGQIFFQKSEESHSENNVYDGYEFGVDAIRRVCVDLGVDVENLISDMAMFCAFCYRYNCLPLDVEFTVAKTYDGPPKVFVHDFDKIVLLESGISVDKALTRLLTQLSYPNEGEWGALFESTFRAAATQLVENECHLDFDSLSF